MKKITAFLLSLSCILTSFSALAADTYESAESVIKTGYIESEKTGNIFSVADKSIMFTQEYENITDKTAKIQSVYQVWDEDGTIVKEYPSRSFDITAGKKTLLEFVVENPGKYGLYTLRVENIISINGASYEKVYEEGFSVCITLGENNVDKDFGFAQQIIRNGFGDADVTPALMRKVGAGWYREDVLTWSMVEQTKGVYTIPEGTKEKLQKIKDSGLKVICILNGTNGKLYKFPSNSESLDAFAAYCGFVAKELDGLVDHYEIWNEWNKKIETDTAGYYKRTDIYAEVLKKAYKAVKDASENNTVIGCVTAGIDYEWIDGVLSNLGAEKAMDAVSVHSYPWSATNGVNEAELVADTTLLKGALQKYSLDIPIFLTEVGFSTFDGAAEWIEPCTKEEQLNSLVLVNALNKAYGLFDKLLQYCFHDRANAAGVESNWGLINCWQRGYTQNPEAELTPYGAKPAYLGIAAMNYFTGGNTEYQQMIKDFDDRAYMFKFKNNNIDKNVILCINGDLNTTTEKSIELGTKNVKIYDKYGNFVGEEFSETGNFTFAISPEPMYVLWSDVDENEEFLSVAINENTKKVTIKGTAEAPGDLVSVVVVSKGEELEKYTPERVLFVGQATADDYGRYSLTFAMQELKGQFEVCANSKQRKEKQKEDLILSYTIPEIKVMQNGADVLGISDLEPSAYVDVELRGFNDLTDEEPALIIAQYSGGRLVFCELDSDAVGDCTKPGAEIKKSFEVKPGVDSIKVMYMNISKLKPYVASYEIK